MQGAFAAPRLPAWIPNSRGSPEDWRPTFPEKKFWKSGGKGLECANLEYTLMYSICRVRRTEAELDLRFEFETRGRRIASDAPFGGGRALRVLNWGCLNSTRTPFFHREERVESGGAGFNTQVAGGIFKETVTENGEVAVRKREKTLMCLRYRPGTIMNQETTHFGEYESSCACRSRRMSQPPLRLAKGEST